MSKINIEVDTITKSIVATLDGSPISDVSFVMIEAKNQNEDFSDFGVSIHSTEMVGDIKKITRLVANKVGDIVPGLTDAEIASGAINTFFSRK